MIVTSYKNRTRNLSCLIVRNCIIKLSMAQKFKAVLSGALKVADSSLGPGSSGSVRLCRRYSSSLGILTKLRRKNETERAATETK